MLSQTARSRIDAYWEQDLGCEAGTLWSHPFQVLTHGPNWEDYQGVYALFRSDASILTAPASYPESLCETPMSCEAFASHMQQSGYRVIGPAVLSFADSLEPQAMDGARMLSSSDELTIAEFREACQEGEWDEGGIKRTPGQAAGLEEDGRWVALASYENWGNTIAHLSVITHPGFRGQGYARRIVHYLALSALQDGLIPMYRALESNFPSRAVARRLGFVDYATSVAVRLNGS